MKEPSPVTVLVGNQQTQEPAEPKPSEERAEKPPNWFWDLLQSKSSDDWKAGIYQVWVTRLADSRVPMAAGEKGYLDMFIEPITPNIVKQKYGGGKYQAVLNCRGRAETSHNFEIEGQPIYDSRRERPGNSSAVAATTQVQQAQNSDNAALAREFVSILRDELAHAREANQAPNLAGDATVEMMSNAAKKAMDIMEKRTPEAGNPAAMLRDLMVVAKETGMLGGEKHGSTLGNLVQELTPLITLVTPFLQKFIAPQDPMAQITTFLAIFEKLDILRGSGGGGGGGGKTTTNDLILEGIKTLPSLVDQYAASKNAQPAQRVPPQRQISPGATPAPAPRPMSPQHIPQAAGTPRPAASSPPPGGPLSTTPLHGANGNAAPQEFAPQQEFVGAPTSDTQPAQMAQPSPEEYDNWVSTRVVEMLYLGFDGDDIVAWLEISKPQVVADIDKYTEDQIEGMFRLNPILIRAIEHPNWKRVLREAKIAAAEAVAAEEDEDEMAVHAKVN